MKKIIVIAQVALFTTFIFPNYAEAKKINLNETITSTGGCKWKITGWIDVSFIPPSINHYDVWVTDCHGNTTHFVGIPVIPDNTNGNTSLTDFESQYNIIFAPVPNQIPNPTDIFEIIKLIGINSNNQNE